MSESPILPASTTEVVITGNLTFIRETTIKRVVQTDDFLVRTRSTDVVATPVLPQGSIFYKSSRHLELFVIQEPPTVRRVTCAASGGSEESHLIAVPSLVYAFLVRDGRLLENSYIFMARSPVMEMASRLFKSFLPNQYNEGRLCEGSAVEAFLSAPAPLANKVDALRAELHTARYNNDLSYYLNHWPSEISINLETGSVHNHIAQLASWTALDESPLARLSTLTLVDYMSFGEFVNSVLRG